MAEQLDTPMWNFAVAVYGRDGVPAECLGLQERLGLDVNLLLFAAYAGAVEGMALARDDLNAAAADVRNWHNEVVRSLRRARQALKAWSAGEDAIALDASAVRKQVKEIELQTERIELFMLWTWLQRRLASLPRSEPRDALAENLRVVLSLFGASGRDGDPAHAVPSLLKAAGSAVQATPG
jgi:uncharacterized protein (TIGR02444 family)